MPVKAKKEAATSFRLKKSIDFRVSSCYSLWEDSGGEHAETLEAYIIIILSNMYEHCSLNVIQSHAVLGESDYVTPTGVYSSWERCGRKN